MDSTPLSEPSPAILHEVGYSTSTAQAIPPDLHMSVPECPPSTEALSTTTPPLLPTTGIAFPGVMYGVGTVGLGLGTSFGCRAAHHQHAPLLALLSTWMDKEDITKIGATLAAVGTI